MSNSTSSKAKESLLLKDYIVIQEPETCQFYVTLRSNFIKQNECKCYNHFGIINDCNTAGCYSFSNTDSEIYNDFKEELQRAISVIFSEDFSIRNLVECLQQGIQPDEISDEEISFVYEIYNRFLLKESHTQITAYTFWNGRNWESISIHSEYYNETDMVEMSENDQIEILSEMPETPHMKGAEAEIETENYIFQFSRFASNPWICTGSSL